MWKRIIWDILLIIVSSIAPWWAGLLIGIAGIVMFPWYIEIIVLGVAYDVIFGAGSMHWYRHLMHTGIFSVPLLIGEYMKTKINL